MAASSSSNSLFSIELQYVFRSLDKDSDGKISAVELILCMSKIDEELLIDEAEALLASVDSDGDGLLTFEEFMKLAKSSNDNDEEEERKGLRVAYEMYEDEREGCITAESLKMMLSRLGMQRDADDCRSMICKFDVNGDGVLSFDEFQMMMHRCSKPKYKSLDI